ncbi:MAG: FlgD immunoglobulin-like domain containing protein, partial [Chloroflexota bacterium]
MAVQLLAREPVGVLIEGFIRWRIPGVPQQQPEGRERGMDSSGVVFATPARLSRGFVVVCLALAVLATSALAAASPVHAASPAPLKAVFIVGPAGSQTSADISDAEQLATIAESYGMDVRRVYHPHATWERVLANIQGANLVYYAGHGYGWPSPYTKVMTESRQNGVGLNSYDGSSSNTYTYYGASLIRANWVLAPNAIVFLNHDCYTAGNGEPGTAVPSWDVARQRVDNFAAGFLAVGARAVFAYSYQRLNRTLGALLNGGLTVEEIFRFAGSKPNPSFGWVGWDPRKFDSVRTPGAKNFMDPHSTMGFLRAITGDLGLTATEWRNGVGNGQPPEISNFAAQSPGLNGFGVVETPFFTPNSDGVTDTMTLSFTVDREAFVDMTVKNESGNVVRTLSAWSPSGSGKATWDGKNGNGAFVPDGDYTVTAVPHNRQGTEGNDESVDVMVMTTMKSPSVTPNLLHASDGDNFAKNTTLSVNLESAATFWWKIADANGNVVRTHLNGVNANPGNTSWQWDGRDTNGAFVPDGTYYSVTTTATTAGTYFHSLPVYVGAFRLATTTVTPPFVRGTKAKFLVYTAEPLAAKPKVKVYAPGVLV